MKEVLGFIVIALALFACTVEQENHLYIGSYRIFDQQIPHPYFFKTDSNRITYLDNEGNELGSVKLDSALVSGDAVPINEQLFYFKHVGDSIISLYDLKDSSKYFYKSHPGKLIHKNFARFKKVPNKPTDLGEVKDKLRNNRWEQVLDSAHYPNPNRDFTIIRDWSLSSDSIHFLTHYYYKEQLVVSEVNSNTYALFDLNDKVFLSLIDEADNPLPIYQVISNESNKIKLVDFNSRYSSEIILKESKQEIEKNNARSTHNFANCFEGFQGEYYFDEVTYLHGNESIQKRMNVNFPKDETEEGYIIIHFNINCKKQVGNLGLIQMDFEYLPTEYTYATVNHLVNQVKSLNDWPATMSSRDWMPYKDVHAFLMFKIQNGTVSDVSP